MKQLLTHKELSEDQAKDCEPALEVLAQISKRLEEESDMASKAVCIQCRDRDGCESMNYSH